MGLYRPLDYHRWAPHLDFASWDNYPPDAGLAFNDASAARMALAHDLMRGPQGRSAVLAHGADPEHHRQPGREPAQAPRRAAPVELAGGGARRGRGALLPAAGLAGRVRAVPRRGHRACRPRRHPGLPGGRRARGGTATGSARRRSGRGPRPAVALLFDWDSWWALEITDGPSRLVRYLDVVLAYYRALWTVGVEVDVVPVSADLSPYQVVVAPVLFLVKDDLPARLEAVAARGGSVLATFLSGRVDVHDRAFGLDVPGPLGPLMGIRVDEWDAREPSVANPVSLAGLRCSRAAGLRASHSAGGRGHRHVRRRLLRRHPRRDPPPVRLGPRLVCRHRARPVRAWTGWSGGCSPRTG